MVVVPFEHDSLLGENASVPRFDRTDPLPGVGIYTSNTDPFSLHLSHRKRKETHVASSFGLPNGRPPTHATSTHGESRAIAASDHFTQPCLPRAGRRLKGSLPSSHPCQDVAHLHLPAVLAQELERRIHNLRCDLDSGTRITHFVLLPSLPASGPGRRIWLAVLRAQLGWRPSWISAARPGIQYLHSACASGKAFSWSRRVRQFGR